MTYQQFQYRFDLIITDMAMPKISGDRLAAEIKKIRRDIHRERRSEGC